MTTADVPCSAWATVEDVQAFVGSSQAEHAEDAQIEELLDIASAWLYRRSAYRYPGECTRTVRPMTTHSGCLISERYAPVQWYDSRTGTFPGYGPSGRRDEGVSEVTLGVFPLRSIVEVKIDGAVFSSANYRIDDAQYLVRIDGSGWPGSNDLDLDDTNVGTWSVRFTFGDDPPVDGKRAACVIANELWLSLSGDPSTSLPPQAQSLVRQGVSIELLNPAALLSLPIVKDFLETVNPHGISRPAAIVSPWVNRPVRRVGTAPGS